MRFRSVVTADGQQITRPDGGQHAGAHDSQAQSPEGAKHLRRQLTPQRLTGCDRFGHETFLFEWHCACVVCTFPQVKALVSKTCSWRTAGF